MLRAAELEHPHCNECSPAPSPGGSVAGAPGKEVLRTSEIKRAAAQSDDLCMNTITEVRWKPLPGSPEYLVSTEGQIRSLRRPGRPRTLATWWDPRDKAVRVSLVIDGHRTARAVAVAVLRAHAGMAPPGYRARHLDGDRTNNSLSNLEWHCEPPKPYVLKGRPDGRGENNPHHKLTEEQVREIRRAYATGTVTLLELAQEYGTVAPNIHAIVHRRSWKHLDDKSGRTSEAGVPA